MSTLMMIGPVQFRLRGLNVQQVTSNRKIPFAEHKVIGAEPVREYMGPDGETVTLKGTIFPFSPTGKGGASGIEALKIARDAALPLPFMRGNGLGGAWYVIDEVEVEEGTLAANGTGREVSFTLKMTSVMSPGTAALGSIIQLFGF